MKHLALNTLQDHIIKITNTYIRLMNKLSMKEATLPSHDELVDRFIENPLSDDELIDYCNYYSAREDYEAMILCVRAIRNPGIRHIYRLLHDGEYIKTQRTAFLNSEQNEACCEYIETCNSDVLLQSIFIRCMKLEAYEPLAKVAEKLSQKNYPAAQLIMAECYAYGFGAVIDEQKALSHYLKVMGHDTSTEILVAAVIAMYKLLEPRIAAFFEVLIKALSDGDITSLKFDDLFDNKKLWPLTLIYKQLMTLSNSTLEKILPSMGDKLNLLIRLLPMPNVVECLREKPFLEDMITGDNFKAFVDAFRADLNAIAGQDIQTYTEFYDALMVAFKQSDIFTMLRSFNNRTSATDTLAAFPDIPRQNDYLHYGFIRLAEQIFERPLPKLINAIATTRTEEDHSYFEVDSTIIDDPSLLSSDMNITLREYIKAWNDANEKIPNFTFICSDKTSNVDYFAMLVRALILPEEMFIRRMPYFDRVKGVLVDYHSTVLLADMPCLISELSHFEVVRWVKSELVAMQSTSMISAPESYAREIVLWQSLHGLINAHSDEETKGYVVSRELSYKSKLHVKYYDHNKALVSRSIIPPELELSALRLQTQYHQRGIAYGREEKSGGLLKSLISNWYVLPETLEDLAAASLGHYVFLNSIKNNRAIIYPPRHQRGHAYIDLPPYATTLRRGHAIMYAANDNVEWLKQLFDEIHAFPSLVEIVLHGHMKSQIPLFSLEFVAQENNAKKVLRYLHDEFGIGEPMKSSKARRSKKKIPAKPPQMSKAVPEATETELLAEIFKNIFHDNCFQFEDISTVSDHQYTISCQSNQSQRLSLILKHLKTTAWTFSKKTRLSDLFYMLPRKDGYAYLQIKLPRLQTRKWLSIKKNSKFYAAIRSQTPTTKIKQQATQVLPSKPGQYDGAKTELIDLFKLLCFGQVPMISDNKNTVLNWKINLKDCEDEANGHFILKRHGKDVVATADFFAELCQRLKRFGVKATLKDYQFSIEVKKGTHAGTAHLLSPPNWNSLVKNLVLSLPERESKVVVNEQAAVIEPAPPQENDMAMKQSDNKPVTQTPKACFDDLLSKLFEPEVAACLAEKITVKNSLNHNKFISAYTQNSFSQLSIPNRRVMPKILFKKIAQIVGESRVFTHPLSLSIRQSQLLTFLADADAIKQGRRRLTDWLESIKTKDEVADERLKQVSKLQFFARIPTLQEQFQKKLQAFLTILKQKDAQYQALIETLIVIILQAKSEPDTDIPAQLFRMGLTLLLSAFQEQADLIQSDFPTLSPLLKLYDFIQTIPAGSQAETGLFENARSLIFMTSEFRHQKTSVSHTPFFNYLDSLDKEPKPVLKRYELADLITLDKESHQRILQSTLAKEFKLSALALTECYLDFMISKHQFESAIELPRSRAQLISDDEADNLDNVFEEIKQIAIDGGCEADEAFEALTCFP